MTPEVKATKDMLFIAPYNYEGLAGWLVRISWYPDANYENRKWHSKLFAFRDYASNDDALAAAQNYRDKWIEDNKGKRYLRSVGTRFSPNLPRNNTSGIVGVNRSEKRKKSGPLWQTTYPLPEGGVANKKFPISIYGEVGALRLAIQARRAGLLTALGGRSITTDEAAFRLSSSMTTFLQTFKTTEIKAPIRRLLKLFATRTSQRQPSLSNSKYESGNNGFVAKFLSFSTTSVPSQDQVC